MTVRVNRVEAQLFNSIFPQNDLQSAGTNVIADNERRLQQNTGTGNS